MRTEITETRAQLRADAVQLGCPAALSDGQMAVWLGEEARRLGEEIRRLRPLADEGRRYREQLIAAAMAEGRRAHGASWRPSEYATLMEGADVPGLKQLARDWSRLADAQRGPQAGGAGSWVPGAGRGIPGVIAPCGIDVPAVDYRWASEPLRRAGLSCGTPCHHGGGGVACSA